MFLLEGKENEYMVQRRILVRSWSREYFTLCHRLERLPRSGGS